MSTIDKIYEYFDPKIVYNKNEKILLQALLDRIEGKDPRLSTFTERDFRDVFALANNNLTPKYMQKGTIVVNDNTPRDAVEEALDEAIQCVFSNPKD